MHLNHERFTRIVGDAALTPRRVGTFLVSRETAHEKAILSNLLEIRYQRGPDKEWEADLTYLRVSTGFSNWR